MRAAAERTLRALVSAIIPARNEEASIARAVESVGAQAEVDEVIVVDDESTDRTGAILEELQARVPKLRVLRAGELPEGWVGKNWALSVGAAEARGEWLLFTDADTFHLPGAMRTALADAAMHGAALVSYSPEQELETWWERALIPFVYCRLAERFSFSRVNDPALADAAANGQFLLVRRDVYEKLGGHGAIRGEILEDVALARNVKNAKLGIYFAAPLGVVRTRMYRSFGAMWQGWTKNMYPLVGGTAGSVIQELVKVSPIVGTLLACTFVWHAGRGGHVDWTFVGVFLLIMLTFRLIRYARQLLQNRYPVRFIGYYVPAVSMYVAVLLASWWKNTCGHVVWKGRRYPAGAPSAS